MKAPRLSEVTARVVAWHNRHPLARRIDPTQVHSIGEVRLPFASASPWGDAQVGAQAGAQAVQAAAPAPTLAEALAQRTARHQPLPATETTGIDGLDVQSMLPEADTDLLAPTPAPAPSPAPDAAPAADIDLALDAPEPANAHSTDSADDDDDGEAALVIPLLDGDEAEPDAPPPAAPAMRVDPAAADGADGADAASAGSTAADSDADADAAAAAVVADLDLAALAPHAEPGAEPTAAATGSATSATGATTPEFPDVHPPPHGQVPASALARAVERRAAGRGSSATAQDPAPAATLGPQPGRWRRLVQALRLACSGRQPGLPPLRAAFSRDFIWPLRPGQVARWAQRHGQPRPVAPADWPQRSIETDRARLAAQRQKGLAHDVPLHVLTAAIGVGDRRIRVLLGADGSVLGPRAYSRPRVGAAAALLAVGLVGAGWSLRLPQGVGADDGAAALAALAASAPVALSASAPTALSASTPMLPASAPAHAASATALAAAASASGAAASGAHQADAAASAAGPGHSQTLAAAPAAPAASPAQGDIRPALSDDDKHAARAAAAKLRGEPPPPPPAEAIQGPVYAVVSPPSRQREAAAGSLVLMQSAAGRLSGPVPEHGELLQSQGEWRAAWWPFASLVDAERARVLLAGRGLKAEVIEF